MSEWEFGELDWIPLDSLGLEELEERKLRNERHWRGIWSELRGIGSL